MFDISKLRVLDLFCGMGGWSIGFYRRGWDCTGVDNVDMGYPYHLILRDMREFHALGIKYDAVVASPPCTEYSQLTVLSWKKGQRAKPDPEKGDILVREAKRVIDEVRPKWWILENVHGSIPYIGEILGKPMLNLKPWVLWGNLPPKMFEFEPIRRGDFQISHTFEHHGKGGHVFGKGGGRVGLPEDFPFDPLRSWKRARIPVWLAYHIAQRCEESLVEA